MKRKREPIPAWMNAPNLINIDLTNAADKKFVEKYHLELHDTAQGKMTGLTTEQYDELCEARAAFEAVKQRARLDPYSVDFRNLTER